MITDLELKKKVETEIAETLGEDGADVAVAVKDGVVTLTGFARRFCDVTFAEQAARKAEGVKGLACDIEVRLPIWHQRTDPQIARAAVQALDGEHLGLAERVFVSVKDGRVTLEGEVASRAERTLAERLVRDVRGVQAVTNRVKVEAESPRAAGPSPQSAAPGPEPRSFAPAGEPVIETTRVREAVCVVDTQEELERLVDALTTHGVDRTDISLMGSFPAVFRKLRRAYRRPEEVADLASVPRRALVTRDDQYVATPLVFGTLLTVGAFGAALPIVASGGALATALIAGLGGGAVAGALAKRIRDFIINPKDAARLEDDLQSGGLVVFVRVDTPEEEARALKIMQEVGADSVHVHEVELARTLEDLPLHDAPLFGEVADEVTARTSA